MTPLPNIFKAISDETRWSLIRLLLTRDFCGKALARHLGITEAAVSQHLKVLREAGLVDGEKRGYWTHYSVQAETIGKIISEFQRMAHQAAIPAGPCHRQKAGTKTSTGKEIKTMCKSCCEKPVKLKDKPEKCTPEQIKECHGDAKEHPCATDKKKS